MLFASSCRQSFETPTKVLVVMRLTISLILISLIVLQTGCGKSRNASLAKKEEPMTLEEWNQLPDDETKFHPQTQYRLKKGMASQK